jgi:hypothetical protein
VIPQKRRPLARNQQPTANSRTDEHTLTQNPRGRINAFPREPILEKSSPGIPNKPGGGVCNKQAWIATVTEGQRNNTLTALGGFLRRKGWERPAIEAELLEKNLRRCIPPLSDEEVRTIAASVSRYPAGGPDPLEEAWQAIQEQSHRSRYDLFLALVRELQRRRGDQPIVLPLKRIATLMECDWSSVRGYRQNAAREGIIYRVADPVPHRRAAQYRVSVEMTGKTIPTIPTIPTIGLVGIPIVGIQESPIVGISGADLPIVGIGADEVLRLAARGFQIFPVTARGKEPLVRWKTEATSHAEQVRKWFEKFPCCNWGIATGERSRIFVLDLDGLEGIQSFADLCAKAGANWNSIAETTLGVKTGKGSHLYFEHCGPTKNTVGKLGAGVDTRGDGGYVVAPPSMHENGEAYFWLGGHGERPIAKAPDWLIKRLCSTCGVVPDGTTFPEIPF